MQYWDAQRQADRQYLEVAAGWATLGYAVLGREVLGDATLDAEDWDTWQGMEHRESRCFDVQHRGTQRWDMRCWGSQHQGTQHRDMQHHDKECWDINAGMCNPGTSNAGMCNLGTYDAGV